LLALLGGLALEERGDTGPLVEAVFHDGCFEDLVFGVFPDSAFHDVPHFFKRDREVGGLIIINLYAVRQQQQQQQI
jgi:hypothetical protein